MLTRSVKKAEDIGRCKKVLVSNRFLTVGTSSVATRCKLFLHPLDVAERVEEEEEEPYLFKICCMPGICMKCVRSLSFIFLDIVADSTCPFLHNCW